ncbi:MAG: hypothetical protein JWN48_5224, partial [Myxococcaceae bacterium]|nr:hypothetical protein [Myxococcaceae bacterium]
MLLALLGHGALLALALQQQPVLARLVDVTEVELMPPAPEPKPEPLPEPKPVPQAPAAQPLTQPSAAPRRARATPVPQP